MFSRAFCERLPKLSTKNVRKWQVVVQRKFAPHSQILSQIWWVPFCLPSCSLTGTLSAVAPSTVAYREEYGMNGDIVYLLCH